MPYYSLHPQLRTWLDTLEHTLASAFDGEMAVIRDAGLSIVSSRGKRLRPVMLLLCCAAYGPITERSFRHAALVELIHTASLAHDDVIDDAQSRRGAPSAPARWGNKFSILLGDFLFSRIFEWATEDGDLAILQMLAQTSNRMGRAVLQEYSFRELDIDESVYWDIIAGKTAQLFAAAAAIGVRIGGADAEQQQTAYEMGMAFGNAFQLSDDLLDLQGSEKETGKPMGVDWCQRRPTLPLLYALQNAPEPVAAEIRALWHQNPFTPEHLHALRYRVEAAGGFEYGWKKVKEYREEASGCLESFPPGQSRDALQHLCHDAFPLPVLPAIGR